MGFRDDFIRDVDFGRGGGYEGIPMQDEMLDSVIAGCQGGRYDLIGGSTGTGKSAFVDDKYILSPIDYLLNNESEFTYKVLLYSQEITKKKKLSKWATYYMFKKHQVIADWKVVLSFGKNRISDDLYQLSLDAAEFFEKIEDFIIFREGGINPTGIYKEVGNYMNSVGKTVDDIQIVDGKEYHTKKYIPNNSKHIVSVITDTIQLLKKESSLTAKKQIIDKHSSYAVDYYRNRYNCLVVDVSQLNRALGNVERLKLKEVAPQLEDFKETGEPSDNADTAIAIFNPDRYNIEEYKGFNVRKMKSNPNGTGVSYRAAFVLKNRNGDDMVSASYRFIGGIGKFDFIKKPEKKQGFSITPQDEEEEMYQKLRLECKPYKVIGNAR